MSEAGDRDRSTPESSSPVDDAAGVEPSEFASLDDPHLQPAARNPERMEKVIAASFVIGIIGFAGLGAAYWQNAQPDLMGLCLAVGLVAMGFGVAAWGKYLMPPGPFVEERHSLAGTLQEQESFEAAALGRGQLVIARRGFLGKLLGACAAIFATVAAFPLLRSLGPLPGKSLDTTSWRRGSKVVTADGRPVKATDLEVGGLLTVFPEGHEGSATAQTVLIRVASAPVVTMPGRETWSPQGYLAFSKICTHAGCPVGLYEEQSQQLLCPCHQSLFDVLDGAVPVFGPAPRPLPQLPLMIDSAGYLRAQSGFNQPVGPGFWERS